MNTVLLCSPRQVYCLQTSQDPTGDISVVFCLEAVIIRNFEASDTNFRVSHTSLFSSNLKTPENNT